MTVANPTAPAAAAGGDAPPPRRAHPVRRGVEILVGLLALLVLLVLVAVLVLTNTDWGREQLRRRVVEALAGTVHGRLKVGRLSGNLLKGLTLHDVAIADSSGAPFLAVDSASVRYGLRSFLAQKIELADLTLWRPDVVLDRQPGEAWNYQRIFPSDSTQPDTSSAAGWGDWIVLRDVRVVDGHVTVRTPWAPDSTLAAAARDSAVRAALDTASRALVVRVPGGYQRVMEFRRMYADLPLLRLAHPDYPARRIEADSLRMLALPFRPPAADVRQLHGALEIDADSLWFRRLDVELPASRVTLGGSYGLETGALTLAGRAQPAALPDLRFALPALPDGALTAALAVAITDSVQRYRVNDLALEAEGATARGTIGLVLGDTLRVEGTNVTFAGVDTRLVERLAPGVDLPRQGVAAGRVAADGSLAALTLDADVTFDDTRAGRSRVRAAGEVGAADGVVRARALRVALDPVQVALARTVAPDLPVGGTLRGTVTVDGSTATRLQASAVDLTHVDRGARSRLTGGVTVALARTVVGRPAAGAAATSAGRAPAPAAPATTTASTRVTGVEADLRLRPLALATVGRFAPAAGLRGTASGPVRVRGTMDALVVDAQLALSGGGAVGARGRLDLTGTPGYDVVVTPRVFNAAAVTTRAPAMSLTGRIAARGRGVDPATMTATLAADLQASVVDGVAIDVVRARLRVADGLLTVDTLGLRAPRTTADVAGSFGLVAGRTGTLAYRVAVDSLGALSRFLPRDSGAVAPRPAIAAARMAAARADSAARARRAAVAIAAGEAPPPQLAAPDTGRAVPRDSVAGALYAAGVLAGNVERVDVRGRAGTVGLVLLGNAVQRARVAYDGRDLTRPEGTVAVAAIADSITVGGFALDSVDARGTWRRPGGTAQLAVYQDVGRSYTARADYAVYPTRRELRFGEMRLRFDTTTWAATHSGAVYWGQPGVEVQQIELTNGRGGRIFVDGRLPTEGPADLRAQVTDFELGDVLGLLQSDVALRGRVSLDAALTGTGRAPVIRGTAGLAGATYGGTVVPDLRTTIDYAGGRLRATAAGTYEQRRVLTATAALPVNLALQGVTGPRLAEGATVVADARLDSLPLDLATRFTDVVADVRGAAVGTLAARGPVKKPTLTGDLRVADARLRLVPTGMQMRRLNAGIRLRGDTVVIDSVSAYTIGADRGRVTLAGGLGIRTPAQPSFDLRLAAAGARVLDNEQGRVVADAQVAMYGPFDRVFVSGGARVRGGVLYIPEGDDTQVLSAGDPAVFAVIDTSQLRGTDLVPAQSPLLENLRMDLFLGVDRDTWVRSPEANIEIFSDGDLRVRVDRAKQAVVLDGIVNTDRGEYTFLSKRFQVKRGTVTFIGTQELNPNLQITGEYEVRQASREPLVIRIQVGGQLRAPRIALESDVQPPIPQTDLLSYLAFGSSSGSLLAFGGSSVTGATPGGGQVGAAAALATRQLAGVAVGVAVDQLESQTGRALGADVFNITPSPDVAPELARAEISGLESFVKGTQVEFGKYFNRQLFVGLQATPVFFQGSPPIPGFRVQYRFARMPGLSLESTYQPRFFLGEPTLAPQDIEAQNALGVFLVRQWRF